MIGLRQLLAAIAGLIPTIAALSSLTSLAYANGRLPGATGLAIHPTDERQLLLGLTYGLALTRDGGASWTWMCEEQIEGNGGDVDPSIVMTSDGTLVVLSLTNGGVLVSRNEGCTFERAMGPLQGHRGVDLTLDPSQPGRVLALLSTITDVVDRRPRYRNLLAHSLDHGVSWEILSEFPDDFSPETVEVAPSDAKRIYVSGTAAADPLEGIVERSDDGGLSWKRNTVRLPRGSGSLFLSAIHPTDPNRLWFRVPGKGDIYGILPARLWLSSDGATSFEQIADTQAGMLGLAVSPDGEQVAYGGPVDGLFLLAADASAPPIKIADLQLSCLRWSASGLYACAGEPASPYSLGYAPDPEQALTPLWHRADTCRDACKPQSTLEMKCQMPWETLAPLLSADRPLCAEPAPTPDAGMAPPPSSLDAGSDMLADASTSTPAAPARTSNTSSGCQLTSPSTPGWLAITTLCSRWLRRRRRSR